LVAEQHDRDWLGIELNPDFAKLAEGRIAAARCVPTPDRQRPAA
jgi:DNA modification methylase